MKNLTDIIQETKNNLFLEIQNEFGQNAAYNTIDIGEAKKKYKYGFISINTDDDFISLVGFNSTEDFSDLLGQDTWEWDDLLKIKSNEIKEIKTSHDKQKWLRLW